MRPTPLGVVVMLLAACATPQREVAEPPAPVRCAALPLMNLAADEAAPGLVLNELRLGLAECGAVFVPSSAIESVLRDHRLRDTASLSHAAATALATATGARYVLVGTLFAYAPGPNPHIALGVRLLDAERDRLCRTASCSLRGSDFIGMLGLGAITEPGELLAEVVARVVRDLVPGGTLGCVEDEPTGTANGSVSAGVISHFRSASFARDDLRRIAILPMQNRTDRYDAAEVMAAAIADQWFRAGGIEVVERAELLAAMRQERVRSVDGMDLVTLARLGKRLGTRYFALGSIELYREEVPVGRDVVAEMEASLRLIDTEQQAIVAAVEIRRRGDDYHWILGYGTVRDPIRLAARVAREMLEAVGA